jgi:CO dehydrogenase/acetyl-CoA synthase epsilon subunit
MQSVSVQASFLKSTRTIKLSKGNVMELFKLIANDGKIEMVATSEKIKAFLELNIDSIEVYEIVPVK